MKDDAAKPGALETPMSRMLLRVVAGPYLGALFPIESGREIVGGRDSSLEIDLSKDELCSHKHFKIECNGEKAHLVDLNSKNGTFLIKTDDAGKFSPKARIYDAELENDDRFLVGHTVFQIVIDRPSLDTDSYVENATAPDGFPKIHGYEIHEILGRGGMGVVFKATRLRDGAPVALKTIKFDKSIREEDIKRFAREIHILASLNHPRIVGFYESNQIGRLHYFTMEYVVGENAEEHVRHNGPMAIGRAVRLASMALEGLEFAHEQGFVHRDVKPNNMLICHEADREFVKLADFGLSKAYLKASISQITPPGKILGAALFLPPEQILDFRSVQPSGDQYGASASLYYFLTGMPLYDFAKNVDVYQEVPKTSPVPIRNRRPEIPKPLADAIHRALERNPGRRFGSIAEFRESIARFSD